MRKVMLLLLPLLLLCGCRDLQEAETLTIVAGFGIDAQEEGYQLNTEVIKLTEGGEESVLVCSKGSTLQDAVADGIRLTGQSLYFTHAQIAVMGRKVAEDGMEEMISAINGQNDYRLSLRMLVAEDTAAQILKADGMIETIKSFGLRDVLSAGDIIARVPDVPFYRFVSQTQEAGIDPILPYVTVTEENEKQVSQITGAALFCDSRLVGTLSEELTQCLLWLRGDASAGFLSAEGVGLKVIHVKPQIQCTARGAALSLKLQVQQSDSSSLEPEMRQKMEEHVERTMDALVNRLQAMGCDSIGLLRQLKRKEPDAWKDIADNWRQTYRTLPVRTDAEIEIISMQRTLEE